MPTFEPGDINATVLQVLGGSAREFFTEHWGRRPLLVTQAAPGLVGTYGVEQYLEDMVATQPVPYVSVGVSDGIRNFQRHGSADELRRSVAEGGVSAIKMNKTWHSPRAPERWAWMRSLFGSLCEMAAMMYMSPSRSEDVDLFLAGPDSQLGCHFDTTETFTIQLAGERRWTIEQDRDLERSFSAARERDWRPSKELEFTGPTCDVVLRPGDSLYVPACSLHRVTGVTWSVSLSLGIRAFNEIDFVEHLLEVIRNARYADFMPAPSAPAMMEEQHAEAKLELMKRVRALLIDVEVAAFGAVLAPLELPPTLVAHPTGRQPSLSRVPATVDEPTD